LFVCVNGRLAVMLEMFRPAVPVFAKVTGWGAPVVPTNWGRKLRGAGDRETAGAGVNPVPLKELCRLVPFVPFTVRSPARGPLAAGVKKTLNPQELPFGTPGALPGEVMTGQVVLCVKSPVVWMLVTWKAVAPVLLKVTGCGLLVTPSGCG